MNFTLKQLRVFQQVANTQSITQAADNLFMTPPAVSKQITNLKAEVDTPIFETVGKKVLLTAEGQQLQLYVDNFLEQAELLKTQMLQLRHSEKAKINLSVINTFQGLLFPFLKRFHDNNPLIEFQMSIVPWGEQQHHFISSEYDFYFGGDVILDKQDFVLDEFDKFQFILVAHPDNPLCHKKLTSNMLAHSQFVSGSAPSGSQQFQEKLFKKWGLENEPLRVDSYASVAEAVKANLGIALLPDNIAEPLLNKNELFKLDFKISSPKYPIYLIRRKNKNLSKVMREFQQFVLTTWRR